MNAIVLDTCVISELTRPRPDAGVMNWLDSSFPRCILSSPVLMELESGVLGTPDESLRARRVEHLRRIVERFATDRRVVFDEAAARAAGRSTAEAKCAGRPLTAVDAQIIGIAQTLNAAIATRDSDFANRGVAIVNPWIEN